MKHNSTSSTASGISLNAASEIFQGLGRSTAKAEAFVEAIQMDTIVKGGPAMSSHISPIHLRSAAFLLNLADRLQDEAGKQVTGNAMLKTGLDMGMATLLNVLPKANLYQLLDFTSDTVYRIVEDPIFQTHLQKLAVKLNPLNPANEELSFLGKCFFMEAHTELMHGLGVLEAIKAPAALKEHAFDSIVNSVRGLGHSVGRQSENLLNQVSSFFHSFSQAFTKEIQGLQGISTQALNWLRNVEKQKITDPNILAHTLNTHIASIQKKENLTEEQTAFYTIAFGETIRLYMHHQDNQFVINSKALAEACARRTDEKPVELKQAIEQIQQMLKNSFTSKEVKYLLEQSEAKLKALLSEHIAGANNQYRAHQLAEKLGTPLALNSSHITSLENMLEFTTAVTVMGSGLSVTGKLLGIKELSQWAPAASGMASIIKGIGAIAITGNVSFGTAGLIVGGIDTLLNSFAGPANDGLGTAIEAVLSHLQVISQQLRHLHEDMLKNFEKVFVALGILHQDMLKQFLQLEGKAEQIYTAVKSLLDNQHQTFMTLASLRDQLSDFQNQVDDYHRAGPFDDLCQWIEISKQRPLASSKDYENSLSKLIGKYKHLQKQIKQDVKGSGHNDLSASIKTQKLPSLAKLSGNSGILLHYLRNDIKLTIPTEYSKHITDIKALKKAYLHALSLTQNWRELAGTRFMLSEQHYEYLKKMQIAGHDWFTLIKYLGSPNVIMPLLQHYRTTLQDLKIEVEQALFIYEEERQAGKIPYIADINPNKAANFAQAVRQAFEQMNIEPNMIGLPYPHWSYTGTHYFRHYHYDFDGCSYKEYGNGSCWTYYLTTEYNNYILRRKKEVESAKHDYLEDVRAKAVFTFSSCFTPFSIDKAATQLQLALHRHDVNNFQAGLLQAKYPILPLPTDFHIKDTRFALAEALSLGHMLYSYEIIDQQLHLYTDFLLYSGSTNNLKIAILPISHTAIGFPTASCSHFNEREVIWNLWMGGLFPTGYPGQTLYSYRPDRSSHGFIYAPEEKQYASIRANYTAVKPTELLKAEAIEASLTKIDQSVQSKLHDLRLGFKKRCLEQISQEGSRLNQLSHTLSKAVMAMRTIGVYLLGELQTQSLQTATPVQLKAIYALTLHIQLMLSGYKIIDWLKKYDGTTSFYLNTLCTYTIDYCDQTFPMLETTLKTITQFDWFAITYKKITELLQLGNDLLRDIEPYVVSREDDQSADESDELKSHIISQLIVRRNRWYKDKQTNGLPQDPIGQGGFSRVYAGRIKFFDDQQKVQHLPVAIKSIPESLGKDEKETFFNEVAQYTVLKQAAENKQGKIYPITSNNNNEQPESKDKIMAFPSHIATLYGVTKHWNKTSGLRHYSLIMEKGSKDLKTYLDNHYTLGKRYSVQEQLQLAYDIAIGLAQLHELNLIHGDLKDENILLFETKNGYQAKLTDLGLSRLNRQTTLRKSTKIKDREGTLSWQAVEVVLGAKHSRTSDMFSFALIILRIVLQGAPLFSDDNKRLLPLSPQALINRYIRNTNFRAQIPDDCDKALKEIIENCWVSLYEVGEDDELHPLVNKKRFTAKEVVEKLEKRIGLKHKRFDDVLNDKQPQPVNKL